MRELPDYLALLTEVKARIASAQLRAQLSVNRELLLLYWQIGQLIDGRQAREGWGARVIPRLANDLRRELPAARGFSVDNLKRMVQFYHAYPDLGAADSIGAQPVPQLHQFGARQVATETASANPLQLPWGHNILILQKIHAPNVRQWYIAASIQEGWSRDELGTMIRSRIHERQGASITNFDATLPPEISAQARQILKDPYMFDFLAMDTRFRERELEIGLLTHLESFLLELGVGFAFVGRQVRLTLGGEEYFVDLLFYHLKLRCYIVIELKLGPFRPEYAGKLNFYLNLVDESLRHPADAPSIGLILCQDRKQILAEYALRGLDKPIGVSEYELTRSLPAELESTLPSIETIEAELRRRDDE